MMEERKRRLSGAGDTTNGPAFKKQVLEEPASLNGDFTAESALDEGLEAFRKEAIWRQMQEYKREFERSASEAISLQSQLQLQEAKAVAVDACWNLLVKDLTNVMPEAAQSTAAKSLDPFCTQSVSLDALREALEGRYRQTKQLFARLSSSQASTSQQGLEIEEMRSRCHALSAETANTKAALSALHVQYDRVRADLEREHGNLLAAEKRLDRLRSKTVQEMDAKAQASAKKEPEEVNTPDVKPAEPALEDAKKTLLPVSTMAVPVDESELNELRDVSAKRANEIATLHASRLELQGALDDLNIEFANLSEKAIQQSIPYKHLQAKVQMLEVDLERARYQSQDAAAQADSLREQQNDFRENATKEAHLVADDLNKRCAKYESDLARIRDQREAIKAEMAELKARDAETLHQVDQIRTLANSRQDRIAALSSETRRLRMDLKAREGDIEMVETLAIGEQEEQLREVQKRLKDAETLAIALRDQLKGYSTAVGNAELQAMIRSETQLREELVRMQERVLHFEQLLSTEPGGDVQVSRLSQAAQQREERLKVLEASLKSKELGEEMLMQEVDRLTAAWTTLDEQNRDKVLQLVTIEEKQLRLTQEKVKADNRYFAAMRSKEAVAQELAIAQKTMAGQTKIIETLQQDRGAALALQAAAEKEISLQQRNTRAHQDRISDLELQITNKTLQLSGCDQQIGQLTRMLNERTAVAEDASARARQVEEQVSKLTKEVDSAKAAHKAVTRKGGVDEDLRSTNENLLQMLKCTSCRTRFKTHVITRCYHLLCQECIESRIANRQRKCPSCSAPFGATDYQQVYF